MSNNELSGRVPNELYRRFGGKCFLGNEGLCGSDPFPRCSFSDFPLSSPAQTVLSTPSSIPLNPIIYGPKRSKKFLGRGAVIALLVSNSFLFVMVAAILTVYCCNKCSKSEEEDEDENESHSRKKSLASNASGGGGGGENGDDTGDETDKSRLVFFDRRKQFELEDLLKASAEMLGKGSLGTVYKAMLEDGCTVVAVKRLKDANPCARKEFEQYMDVIGRVRHPNVVSLKAYYYAREEKLLVYDYLSNGTLYSLLHGNRGPGRIPLDWTTRISLVLGAARGLAKIHTAYDSTMIPHGNVKSSNILLDKNGLACISDFGLSLLLHPADAVARLGGYKAPEQSETLKLSQQADVYSFGVLILEVLTGKAPPQFPRLTHPLADEEEEAIDNLPRWVRSVVRNEWTAEVFDEELHRYKNIEEEMVAMLHVAMACVVAEPEKRPSMGAVVKMIEEIRVEQSPLGEEYDESRNSLSPSFVATEGAF